MPDLTILAGAAHEAIGHVEASALGFGPGGWVALSMLVVFGIMLYAKVPAIIAAALDRKISEIRENLAAAKRLRGEAEALKAEYEAKLADAGKQAEAMKAHAEDEAKAIIAKAKADAAALIGRRTKSAEDKIAAAERAAIAEVRARAAQAATAAAAHLIATNHDAGADRALVDGAIARLN